jgi:hypothetical protein
MLGELGVGEFRMTDRRVAVLADRLSRAGVLDNDLTQYVTDLGASADEAWRAQEYDNPAIRAWQTIRHQVEEVETEAEIEEDVDEDVESTGLFQIYAWSYSGMLGDRSQITVKLGYAGTGPSSDAWRRMNDATRTTGSPGAPTMLRVWQGRGDRSAANEAESSMHRAANRRVIGGGDEWFQVDLAVLDNAASQLSLDRCFGVDPV